MDNNINDKESDKNINIQLNDKTIMNQNGNINQENLKEYINFLNNIKNNFENSYKDVLIKQKINLGSILDALFKNDFSNIIESSQNKNDNKLNKLINECLNELNTIQYKEEENQNRVDYLYNGIKSSKFQVETQKIFFSLINNRKYKDLIEKIKDYSSQNQNWNNENNIVLYQDLEQKLIQSGGFDERNANHIVKIIEKYMYYSNEIKGLDEDMRKYRLCVKENFELELKLKQLKKIKNYLQEIIEELKYYNTNNELNEMNNIKAYFEKNVDKYINNSVDNNFKVILKEILEFIHEKNIPEMLDSLNDIFKDIESNFYIDETLNLVSYCWCIQNGHDDIVEF